MPNFGVYMTEKIDPFAHALQGGGGVVGPDHAFATLVHENPTSRFFFHRFPESRCLSPKYRH